MATKPLIVLPFLLFISGLFLLTLFPLHSGYSQNIEGEVSIEIRDSTFIFKGGALRPGEQNLIMLNNQDTVRHGFTSEILRQIEVEVEGEFGDTYGKGIRGVHINPGETLEIRLIPVVPGKMSFRCDLHPEMKGELLVLSIGAV